MYSEYLTELFDQRQRVDYDFYTDITANEVEQLMDYASKFIQLAKIQLKEQLN